MCNISAWKGHEDTEDNEHSGRVNTTLIDDKICMDGISSGSWKTFYFYKYIKFVKLWLKTMLVFDITVWKQVWWYHNRLYLLIMTSIDLFLCSKIKKYLEWMLFWQLYCNIAEITRKHKSHPQMSVKEMVWTLNIWNKWTMNILRIYLKRGKISIPDLFFNTYMYIIIYLDTFIFI